MIFITGSTTNMYTFHNTKTYNTILKMTKLQNILYSIN